MAVTATAPVGGPGNGVSKFIPNLWAASLIEDFYSYSRIGVVTWKPQIVNGDRIIFNSVSPITINDFNCHTTVEYQTLDLKDTEIVMDQKKYFAFEVCDIENKQAAGPLINPHIRQSMQTAYKVADTWAFQKMANEADPANTVALGALTPDNVFAAMNALVMKLMANNVPLSESYIVLPYDVVGLLNTNPLFTHFKEVLTNGILEGSNVLGVQLVFSPDIPAGTVFAIHKSAFAFGYQIDKIDYFEKSEVTFASRVKGLQVYGGGLVRPAGLIKGTYTIG